MTLPNRSLEIVLRTLFPTWDIVHHRGTWVANGAIFIRASTVDLLILAIYDADPDSVQRAADILSLKPS